MSDTQRDGVSPVEDKVTLEDMWAKSVSEIGEIDPQTENWKTQALPLARIKKIMKSEEFVMQELEKERVQVLNPGQEIDAKNKIKFMISQEGPMLMTKACELLIKELTVRAWQHTEHNRRRTLQRADLHAAVGESEVFDFLIDIVPRVATTRQPQASDALGMSSQLSSAMQAANNGNVMNIGDNSQMPSQEQIQQQMQYNFLLQQMQQQGTQPQMDGTEQLNQPQQQQQNMQQQDQQSISQTQWTDPQV